MLIINPSFFFLFGRSRLKKTSLQAITERSDHLSLSLSLWWECYNYKRVIGAVMNLGGVMIGRERQSKVFFLLLTGPQFRIPNIALIARETSITFISFSAFIVATTTTTTVFFFSSVLITF